jgi:hypothetical protein
MSLLSDSELAVTKSVPKLDGSIAGSGDNLSVVGRERNGQNIVGVANKSSGGGTSRKLPEAESLVPRGRESVGTVGGDNLNYSQHSFPIERPIAPEEEHTQSDTICE